MLAYRQGGPATYDPGLTALSFGAGVGIMGLGFLVALRGEGRTRVRLAGGAVLGGGVVVLHYIGMAALQMPGDLTYSPLLVIVSIVLSIGLGSPALAVAFGPVRPWARTIAALLMFAMVLSLHFT